MGAESLTVGGCKMTTMGMWSVPVEGRGVSHEDTKEGRRESAQARSRTHCLEMVSNGKQV